MDENDGSGLLTFAGVILILAGVMRFMDALWAFRYKGTLPDRLEDSVLGSTLKNYAWLYVAVGCVLILAGAAVMARSQFGRWVGIIAAGIGGLSAMTWMPYFPVWSLTYVILAIVVIYALAKYGDREPAT